MIGFTNSEINGLLVINKYKNFSSFDILRFLKKAFPFKVKMGYAGTLDPFATGVLPISFGECSKLLHYLVDEKKEYHFCMKFGEEMNTGDISGVISNRNNKFPSKEELLQTIKKFVGNIDQRPHKFSAIKVNGKRAYALARQGIDFSLPYRKVYVESIDVISYNLPMTVCLRVVCGKGLYVRSLAEDIAREMGCYAYVVCLKRVASGIFTIFDSITLQDFMSGLSRNSIKKFLIPMTNILQKKKMLLSCEQKAKIVQGVSILNESTSYNEGEILSLIYADKLVALAKVTDNVIKPVRGFNY